MQKHRENNTKNSKYIYKQNNEKTQQTIQKTVNIYINKTMQKHRANNTENSKYKYTYYQNTHTIVKTPPHKLTHTLQNKLKQPQYKILTK
jgi:hypothetical protein